MLCELECLTHTLGKQETDYQEPMDQRTRRRTLTGLARFTVPSILLFNGLLVVPTMLSSTRDQLKAADLHACLDLGPGACHRSEWKFGSLTGDLKYVMSKQLQSSSFMSLLFSVLALYLSLLTWITLEVGVEFGQLGLGVEAADDVPVDGGGVEIGHAGGDGVEAADDAPQVDGAQDDKRTLTICAWMLGGVFILFNVASFYYSKALLAAARVKFPEYNPGNFIDYQNKTIFESNRTQGKSVEFMAIIVSILMSVSTITNLIIFVALVRPPPQFDRKACALVVAVAIFLVAFSAGDSNRSA